MDAMDLQGLYEHGHGDCSLWTIMIAHVVEGELGHSPAFIYLDARE
jgi:hypothetical protein